MMFDQPDALSIVRQAASRWADRLIDFGPRNTLLYFKERQASTLDLAGAVEDGIVDLLRGQKVRLRALFPDQGRHNAACTTARGLRRKLVELEEEQGIQAGWVARGLVCMVGSYTRGSVPMQPLRAPLILHQMALESRTATENDFTLELPEAPEINPVLLYALERQYGVEADISALGDRLTAMLAETSDPRRQLNTAYELIAKAVAPSGLVLQLEPAVLAGVFSFDKLPMVEDLRNSAELLALHPVIGAMAGDQTARQGLRTQPASEPSSSADRIDPANEFLVHDADSSQQRVIDAVLAGRHVVIEGPPGTGKSQTIANIIAFMAAMGRSVLFVSEKRAAIEAVMNRLGDVGLDNLVFDLHDRKISKRRVAERIAKVLAQAGAEPPVEATELHHRLRNRRHAAQRHPAELHEVRQPWGLSAFQVIEKLLALPTYDVSRYNLRASNLRQLDRNAIEMAREDLRAYVDSGGLRIWRGESPWAKAAIRTPDDVAGVLVHLDQLAAGALQDAQQQIRELVDRAGLDVPDDLAAWTELFDLLGKVDRSIASYGADVFGPGLDDFVYAVAPRRLRPRRPEPIGLLRRMRLRRELRRTCPAAPRQRSEIYRGLVAAMDQRERWQKLSRKDGAPTALAGADLCMSSFVQVRNHLAAVAACARIDGLDRGPATSASSTVADLAADRDTLFRMPELNKRQERLRALGLTHLLNDLASRQASSAEAADRLLYAWLQVVLDEMRMRVPYLGQFVGKQHASVVEDFRVTDGEHIGRTAARVRRNVAVNLRKVRDTHPDQNTLVRQQAAKKSRHLPLRRLLGDAPEVLLAAFPCWAMSPLVVSRILPAAQLFDMVIFDEASQIEPHDAVASIMRGSQLVVAGDPKQLPPTPFFRRLAQQSASGDDEDLVEESLDDYESVLDVLGGLISDRYRLTWHYRSRDERLIAFSNVEIYDRSLVTFPGVRVDSPLRHEVVDGRVVPGQGSSPEEVDRVVDLVLEHAEQRPDESLGVITMGQKHALRIEATLRSRRREHEQLDDFFSQDRAASQRFFVKSLENVQGDERDAIILSIGYAKTRDGRLPLRFGPLNQEGGERRLNVAVTRARSRMTVVSAFSHHDMDPSQTTATKNRGPELLRRYLEFVALDGDLGARQHTGVELNGLERSVLHAVQQQGIRAVPQWGVSGYRIDLALAHPEQPGRMVLAVETDGHTYHRAHSARDRDRLRQQHLERLGWEFHRIWSTDWYGDPAGETARLVARWKQAVDRADRAGKLQARPAEPTRTAPPPPPAPPASRRGPRPMVPSGLRITEYTREQLVRLSAWLLSDQLQRDRDERLQEAMTELGFRKRGSVIIQRLTEALEIAQQRADREAY
ncbi:AAA domain-containing protein [Plantactinospora sp. KLBMP9567]|uniref:AAA domain-containing protein n=1 Tax=Plantactinospora sp. KLBMP9567 TaxID=3085900 RepID=UPI0029815E18|nr:AAA domain-containing protein [Plantactinospora sp. KLBMP9567]MDW5330547.1 AAA domain-containing protein [Plantactinospora sp. KLBMP9567]